MAIKTISQFDAATPTSNDKILFEQNGEGKSCSIGEAVNACSLIKGFDLIPAGNVAVTDIFCIQDIVFIEGYISSNFGTGVGKTILTLTNGYKLLNKLWAPITCYGALEGEIGGDKNSNSITVNISQAGGEAKFNFFFRVTK